MSKRNLKDAGSFKTIVLADVLFLDEEEKKAIQEYVRQGGSLYVSGSRAGRLLSEMLGITFQGETEELLSYIAPTEIGSEMLPGIEKDYPLTVFGRQALVKGASPAEVLATITLPYTDPYDTTHFVSIHSDPPGKPTTYPAVILRTYGKGRLIWVAHPIEKAEQPPHRRCFQTIIRNLSVGEFTFEVDAPPAVEVTAFHQPRKKRYILHFLNMQEELPAVSAVGIKARLKMKGKKCTRAVVLPDDKSIPHRMKGDSVEVDVPAVDIYRMIAIEYA
jgi:hypothetical protein